MYDETRLSKVLFVGDMLLIYYKKKRCTILALIFYHEIKFSKKKEYLASSEQMFSI